MLDKIYFNSNHLTPVAYIMLDSEILSSQEKQLMLAHINSCDLCMERYIESLTEDSLLEPDEALSNTIMQNIGQIKDEMKEKSRKAIFFQFAKLSAAVCLTMGIFFSGALGFKINEIPRHNEQNKPQQSQQVQQAHQRPANTIKNDKPSFFDGLYDSINSGFRGFADQINLGYKGDAINATK